ncbi:MAG: type II toxin-antitoxin system RelE/ParE family toxin [Candidatus Omnitrophica bacterium]|nr:type II toxin-antitoxin system RelE/ParE family toxin [Candidatus Omnitrophota bacterium]
MNPWRVEYHPKVFDDFQRNVADKDRDFLVETIEKRLAVDPDKAGKPLGGNLSGYRRLRVSKYRVVYRVKRQVVTIFVLVVDRREDVYEEALKRLGID